MNRIVRYLPCFLFAFASSLTSCESENEPIMETISFAAQTKEMHSRAPIVDGAEDTEDFNSFVVWGNYNNTKAVFTAQEVRRSAINPTSIWEYTPVKEWVATADSYVFSAYSPSGVGTPTVVGNMLQSITVDTKTYQQDLMMAYTTVPKANFGRTVIPTFNHALGAINFNFSLAEDYTYTKTYTVKSVQLTSVYTQGTFTLNTNNTITPTVTGSKNDVSITATNATFTNAQPYVSDHLFVIPQKGDKVTLTVVIEVDGETKTLTQENFSIDWEMGKITTYNITINPFFYITVQTTDWERVNSSIEVSGSTTK